MRKDAEMHRRVLIETAADVLSSEGYRIPLEAIIAKARLGRGTMYRNFKDREAIVVAVLEHVLQKLKDFFIENRSSPTLFRDFMAFRAYMGGRHLAATTDLKDHALAIAAVRERAEQLYDQVLAVAHASGQVTGSVDRQKFSAINQMLIAAARESGERQPNDVIHSLIDLVMDGVRPR